MRKMLELKDAMDRAVDSLFERTPPDQTWVILEKHTIETQSAWVFFYNTKEFAETRSIHRLAGNGPIFVNKKTGAVKFYGSLPPVKDIIKAYEDDCR